MAVLFLALSMRLFPEHEQNGSTYQRENRRSGRRLTHIGPLCHPRAPRRAAEVAVSAVAALPGSEVDARSPAQLGVADAACVWEPKRAAKGAASSAHLVGNDCMRKWEHDPNKKPA